MPTVTVRDLARNTAAVIQVVEFSGRLAPVTRNGKPVAALVPVDKAALEDWLLTHAAEFARAAAAADADLAAGRARSAEWQRARRPAEDDTGDGAGAGSESSPKHPRGPIASTDPATLPAPHRHPMSLFPAIRDAMTRSRRSIQGRPSSGAPLTLEADPTVPGEGTKHSTLCRSCAERRVAEVDGGSPLAAP